MKNFFLGFVIGIGKILPGISGSLIAIRFNIYEKIIDSIINYFRDIKKNTIFLFPIFIGTLLSILLLSNIILFFLEHYYLATMLVFIFLIISGVPDLYRKGGNHLISIISFFIILFLFKIPVKCNIGYFQIGMIESLSMIIPGISGTAIYMSLGVYEKLLKIYTDFNMIDILVFVSGFICSSLITIKVINFFFKRYKKETYSAILGFLLSSIIMIFI